MLIKIVRRASLLQSGGCPPGLAAMMAEEFKSLKGQLLLDSGLLTGSFFHRTVVLICQHDAEGAFGLVLNRASDNKVEDAIAADLPDQLSEELLYIGGPVQPSALSYLHTGGQLANGNVLPDLAMGHSLEGLAEIGAGFSPEQQVRIFAGYSGWGPGQLEDEMRREAWVTHPAALPLVFYLDPKHLWKHILRQKDWKHKLISEMPEDLSWN